MRDWEDTLDWYREHNTTNDLGFNPDGMCLKICRTARDLPAVYPSAKAAQDATPHQYRVTKVADLRRGMVLYFDEVGDSNPYGHVCTMVGRVKGFDWDDLNDVLVETNSVKSGQVVVVRASYFEKYWGDKFQFGSAWLNGYPLDIPTRATRVERFKRSGPVFNVRHLDKAIRKDGRADIKRYRNEIDAAVTELSDNPNRKRIAKVIDQYEDSRELNLPLLDRVVKEFPDDKDTLKVRNALRKTIKSLPDK